MVLLNHAADDLRAPEIEQQVIDIEHKVCAAYPEVVALFVKPQTARTFRETVHRRFGEPASDVDARPPAYRA